MNNFNFRLYLDTRYQNNNPDRLNQYEVKIRVASKHTGKYKLIKTDIFLTEKVFNALYPAYVPKKIRAKKTFQDSIGVVLNKEENQILKDTIDRILLEWKNADSSEIRTFEQLLGNKGYKSDTVNLIDWIENYKKRDISDSNKTRIDAAYKKLNSFYQHKTNKEDKLISLYDVTPKLLNDFESWMLDKKNHTIGTVINYTTDLRKVVNLAVKSKDCSYNKSSYPFYLKDINEDGYIIKVDNNKPVTNYIDDQEREKFEAYEPQTLLETIAKDIWLFSYYSVGINAKDIYNFKWSQISEDKEYLTYYRKKTTRQRRQEAKQIKLYPIHWEIIERHKGTGEYLFNLNENYSTVKKLTDSNGRQLKKIAKKLDISTKFMFMSARSSSFTNLSKHFSGEEIRKTLNTHTKPETTEIYLKRLNSKEKVDDMFDKLHKK